MLRGIFTPLHTDSTHEHNSSGLAVDADVVRVAAEALVVLLGPAGVLILLRILDRLFVPPLRRLARFDRLVLCARVVLLGRVDEELPDE